MIIEKFSCSIRPTVADVTDYSAANEISPRHGRRACLGALAAGLAALVMPPATTASEDNEIEQSEPLDPAMIRTLVGRYELRREWLFEGTVCVEKPRTQVTLTFPVENAEPTWVEHWRAPLVPLNTDIVVNNGRLEVITNYTWSPPGPILLGPGPIFSARIDGKRETIAERHGALAFLRRVERDEHTENLVDGIRHIQEWWIRHSLQDPWEGLQVRTTTIAIESPGMLIFQLNHIQSEGEKVRQVISSLHFKRIS